MPAFGRLNLIAGEVMNYTTGDDSVNSFSA